MSVYTTPKSPFWQFDFQRKGYRFFGATDVLAARPKAEAKAFEDLEKRAADELVAKIAGSGRKPVTVGEAFDRWWNDHGQHLAEDLKTPLDWLRGQIGERTRLHEITDNTVSTAVAERRKHVVEAGRTDKGVQLYAPISPRTVNQTVTFLLRRVLRRAVKHWNAVILREPDWTVHILPVPRRLIVEMTAEVEERIEAVEREGYGDHRRFTLITGLRRREGLLRWPQVDFENACVRLIGKGNKIRVIPLTREAYEILWRQRGHHAEWVFTFVAKRKGKEPRSGRLYEPGKRYPITYWGLGSEKERSFAKAGYAGRWHDLRHTAGRRTTRANGNLKLTQMLLGHSDIATTANFYEDVLVEDLRQAMENTATHLEKSRTVARARAEAADKRLTSQAKQKRE